MYEKQPLTGGAVIDRWPTIESSACVSVDEEQVLTLRNKIRSAIQRNEMPTYVYTYPRRQTYRPLPSLGDRDYIFSSLRETPSNFNLYLHFPFCRQICHYCTLYAVAGHTDSIDEYIDVISTELRYYANGLRDQRVRTIYLGGGTPSVLTEGQLGRVFSSIEKSFPGSLASSDEVCIEADPNTLTIEKTRFFKSLGIDRVNLGVQTFSDTELIRLGRRYMSDIGRRAIGFIKEAQIENLCVDLINGLLGQTRQAWEESVCELLQLNPETFCIYPLTVRPATGYYSHRDVLMNSKEIYDRYDLALLLLMAHGYQQETHIRYVIPGRGGYKQKEYHWEGATILGIGAGARTYAPTLHFRNGYSSRNRSLVLSEYLGNVASKGHYRIDGYLLDEDEQIRREFALNLHRLRADSFSNTYGCDFYSCFPTQLKALEQEEMIVTDNTGVQFTNKGYKYRDLISALFFSEKAMALEAEYTYND